MSSKVLALVSNGTVFISPPCMVGVPVEKVVEGSAYWMATWTSFGETMQKMEETLKDYEKAISQGLKAKRPMQPIHALAGLKDYFDKQGFHPNQLLSKEYITGSGLVDVDVLFKLKKIMEILREASQEGVIQVQPLSWIRGRLAFIIQREESKDTLKTLLQSFDADPEFDTVQNVCDLILRPPGYVRPKPQQTQVKKEEDEASAKEHNATSKTHDVKYKVDKDVMRRLHQKTYVPVHVNADMKARYEAYKNSQRELDQPYGEETAREESEDTAEDGDYME